MTKKTESPQSNSQKNEKKAPIPIVVKPGGKEPGTTLRLFGGDNKKTKPKDK
jgi:hypothetical protein